MKRVIFIEDTGPESEKALDLLRAKGFRAELVRRRADLREEPPPEYSWGNLPEDAPIGIFRSNLDGKFLTVNKTLARILGYDSPEELMETVNRRSIAEVIYPEPQRRKEIVEDIMTHEGWQVFQLQYRCRDGGLVTCRDYIRYVQGADGKESEIEGFVEDITERTMMERALRESEERYRLIVETSNEGIWQVDREWRTVYANRRLEEMLGCTPGSMIGLPISDFMDDEGRRHADELIARREEGLRETHDFRFVRRDGTMVDTLVSASALSDASGRFIGAVAMITDISVRKKAEEELLNSNELLRAVIDAAPTAIIGLDLDGRVRTVWNRAAERMLGWSADEVMGRFLPTVPVDNKEEFRRFRETIRSGRPLNGIEVRRQRRDGTPIDYSIYTSPLHGADGRITGIIADLVDITERKKSEAELQRSEEKYRAVADFTYDWETWMDADGRFIYVSPSCERITGFLAEDFIADPSLLRRILHPDDREEVARQLADAAAGTELVHHMDFRIITRSGEERWIEHICQPIFGTSEKWLGRRASNRDITDRKRTEDALRESEEKFRVLAQTSPTAICLYQGEKLVYANPATEYLFGYSNEELLRMRFWDWAHADFRDTVRERGLARQKGEPVPNRYESMFVTKSGEERWLVVSAGTIEYRGRPAGIASFLDITEIKGIEERLKNSLAEKDILLKEVHHRVKNNLQIITSLLDLQSEYIKEEQSRRYIRDSQGRIRSMALVHEQLYKSSDLSHIDFEGYVNELVNSLRLASTLDALGVKVEVHVSEVSLDMETAIPCGLIINELVSNALKHAFPGGREGNVSVDCHSEGEATIILEVRDNGVGLPPGFDFRNTDSMGLLIVNLLVRQLKGSIELRNGNGVSFRIRFMRGPAKKR